MRALLDHGSAISPISWFLRRLRSKRFPTNHLCRRARQSFLHRDYNSATLRANKNSVFENKQLEAQPNSFAASIKNKIAAASIETIRAPFKKSPNVDTMTSLDIPQPRSTFSNIEKLCFIPWFRCSFTAVTSHLAIEIVNHLTRRDVIFAHRISNSQFEHNLLITQLRL